MRKFLFCVGLVKWYPDNSLCWSYKDNSSFKSTFECQWWYI